MAEPATDPGSDGSYGASFGTMAADASAQSATREMSKAAREHLATDTRIAGELEKRGEEDRARSLEAFKNEGIKPEEFKPWNAEAEHKKFESDPIMGFGSSGALFAMIASAFTKAPMLSAIEGMSGALNGIKQGNEAGYERAYETYKQNLKTAKERHEIQHQAYTDSLALSTHDLALSSAKLKAEAARFGDKQVSTLIEHGLWKELHDTIAARNRAMESAYSLGEKATERGLRGDILGKSYTQIAAENDTQLKEQVRQIKERADIPDDVKAAQIKAAETQTAQTVAQQKMRAFNTVMLSGKATSGQQVLLNQFIMSHPTASDEWIAEYAEDHGILPRRLKPNEAAGQEVFDRLQQDWRDSHEGKEPPAGELANMKAKAFGSGAGQQRSGASAQHADNFLADMEKNGIVLRPETKAAVTQAFSGARSAKAQETAARVAAAASEIRARQASDQSLKEGDADQIIREAIAVETPQKIDQGIVNELPQYEGMKRSDLGYIGAKSQERILNSFQSLHQIEYIADYAAANPESIGLVADAARKINVDAYKGLLANPGVYIQKLTQDRDNAIDAAAKDKGLSQDAAAKAKVLNKMLATQAFADAAQAGSRGATIYLDKAFREIYQQASSPPAFFDILHVRQRDANDNLERYKLGVEHRKDTKDKFKFWNEPESYLRRAVTPKNRTVGDVPVPPALSGVPDLQYNAGKKQWRDKASGKIYDEAGVEVK